MKGMKKSLSILLSCIVFFGLLFAMPVEMEKMVSAESLYIHKIVSVVYDDSGSMKSKGSSNWAYASYAMQTFCGLLNSEDQLYITYMSEIRTDNYTTYEPHKMDLSSDHIQKSVETIRSHVGNGGTPYFSIDAAFNKLKRIDEADENTQFWLVVITDGAFEDKLTNESVNAEQLTNKLTTMSQEKMSNGTNIRTSYFAIGEQAIRPQEDLERDIFVYSSAGAKDIVEVMSVIANKVSGRSRIEPTEIRFLSDDTVQITSTIPLINIAVLVQNTQAKLQSAKLHDGAQLNIEQNVFVRYPVEAGFVTDETLIGNAYLIGQQGNNIIADTYTFTFDGAISKDDLVIMFEPALEIRLTAAYNGAETTDFSVFNESMAGDVISLFYKLYEVGTMNEIDFSVLPSGTTAHMEISENGKIVKQSDGKEMCIENHTLSETPTRIRANVTIPGFQPIEFIYDFIPTVHRVRYTIEAEFENGIREIEFETISQNTQLRLLFSVYGDGVRITDPKEIEALSPQIEVESGNDGEKKFTNDGKIAFVPKYAERRDSEDGFYSVAVTCKIGNASCETTYRVLTATYNIVGVDATESVIKTKFAENTVGVCFYIERNGVRLTGDQIKKEDLSVVIDEKHQSLTYRVEVSQDGTITIIPYSSEPEQRVNVLSWWFHWVHYFGVSGQDVTISLSHKNSSATGTAVLPVAEASVGYVLFCVLLPLLVDLLIAAAIIAYFIRYCSKERFVDGAVLYAGEVRTVRNTLVLESYQKIVRLTGYNKFSNLWNPFQKLTCKKLGMRIRPAGVSNVIFCAGKDIYKIDPLVCESDRSNINDVVDQSNYNRIDRVEIRDIINIEKIKPKKDGCRCLANCYYMCDVEFVGADGNRVRSCKVFCYRRIKTKK